MEKEMKDVEISAINAEIVHEIQYEKWTRLVFFN